MTLEQLQQQRDALRAARYQGVLTVRAGDKWVTYKSDAEMPERPAPCGQRLQPLTGKLGIWRVAPGADVCSLTGKRGCDGRIQQLQTTNRRIYRWI